MRNTPKPPEHEVFDDIVVEQHEAYNRQAWPNNQAALEAVP